MTYLYLGLIFVLGIYEIRGLKKKGEAKDIVFLIGSMVLIAVFGWFYFSNTFRPSIAGYFLDFFKVKW